MDRLTTTTHLIRYLIRLPVVGPAVRQIRIAFVIVMLVIGVGITGYVFIADFAPFEALYQTILTVTTIGFQEIEPLDRDGRTFTIILAIFGVGAVLYLATSVAGLVIEGELKRDLRSWRMTHQIDDLRNHLIICGAGRVGREIAIELHARPEQFVIIDPDPARIETANASGWLTVLGDASNNDTLARAGLEHARSLIAATASDATNTFITLTAKALHPDLSIIARANDHDAGPKLQQAGADRVISPTVIAGRRMAFAAIQPSIVDVVESLFRGVATGDVLAQVDISPGAPWDGATLADAFREHPSLRVLGIRFADGRLDVAPASDVRLSAGDAIMIFGSADAVDTLSGADAPT